MTPDCPCPGVSLWNADALAVLRTLPDDGYDSVIADPPYNVKCPYESYADDLPSDEYGYWCGLWFAECHRIARRFVVVFPGHRHLGMWFRARPPSGVGCWHKPGSPKGGGSFRWCEWEPWLVWAKGGAWIGASDTITAPLVSHGQKDTGGHPCPKPPRLFAELLKRLKPADVLDPFFGSGNLLVECVKAGIPCGGIEVAPGYYATGRRRVMEAAGEGVGQLTNNSLFIA